MLTWLVVAAMVVGGYLLLRKLGWRDKPLEQAYGQGAMVLLASSLRELGYASETAIYSVYRDARLLTEKGGLVVVGIADHASGKKMGFAFEVIPGERIIDGTMLSANLASHHQSKAQAAMISGTSLVQYLRAEEEAK